MAENNDNQPTQDRRLQSLVYDLDKKVHALEVKGAATELELAHMKGEIIGIRTSTASSFEVKAAGELINQNIANVSLKVDSNDKLVNERLDQIRKDVAGMRTMLLWIAGAIASAIFAAVKWGNLFGIVQ